MPPPPPYFWWILPNLDLDALFDWRAGVPLFQGVISHNIFNIILVEASIGLFLADWATLRVVFVPKQSERSLQHHLPWRRLTFCSGPRKRPFLTRLSLERSNNGRFGWKHYIRRSRLLSDRCYNQWEALIQFLFSSFCLFAEEVVWSAVHKRPDQSQICSSLQKFKVAVLSASKSGTIYRTTCLHNVHLYRGNSIMPVLRMEYLSNRCIAMNKNRLQKT